MTGAELAFSFRGNSGVGNQIDAAAKYADTAELGIGCQAFQSLWGYAQVWAKSIGSDIGGNFPYFWNLFARSLGCEEPAPGATFSLPGDPNLKQGDLDDIEQLRTLLAIGSGGGGIPEPPPYTGPPGPGSEDRDFYVPPPGNIGDGHIPGSGGDPNIPKPIGNPGDETAGGIGFLQPEVSYWGQLSLSSSPEAVFNAAKEDWGSSLRAIAAVQGAASLVSEPCFLGTKGSKNWAGTRDGVKWEIPVVRGPDCDAAIVPGSEYPSSGGGGTTVAPPGGSTGLPLDLTGHQPHTITVRKCPKGMVLAVNGLCYWRKMLPAALRMNRSRKAPVSYSDARAIAKGNQAARRIKSYEKRIAKDARKFVPPRRRTVRKPPPSC